jgi:O-antigen/teichoic acid export membrane protein
MLGKTHMRAMSWTLADQAVVSLGTFLINVLLARTLELTDFGIFALINGILLTLQIFTASLLYYPVSVRLGVASERQRPGLTGASFALTAIACAPLCAALAVVIVALGRAELLLPALLYLTLWQVLEAARRNLMALLRHRDAVLGDAISYLGQSAVVGGLAAHGSLTLANAFYAMALTSALAAIIQIRLLTIAWPGVGPLYRTALNFWAIGSWSLANNLVSILRVQIFPWILTGLHGPAAVATFQAAFNVANLVNPVSIGLCNIIPQVAAKAHAQGKRQAWLAARPFVLLGVPPTFLYCGVALVFPELILRVMYGAGSPYLDATVPVRLMITAWLISYAADMTCSYLHGVEAAKTAFYVNALGAAAAVILAFPLTTAFGLIGSAVAFPIAGAVRLLASQILLTRIIDNDRHRFA